jgi:hypothetical protein
LQHIHPSPILWVLSSSVVAMSAKC